MLKFEDLPWRAVAVRHVFSPLLNVRCDWLSWMKSWITSLDGAATSAGTGLVK